MKNFKKVLALVLAVVMLLSFATVASAKTVKSDYYKDADDIDYTEAVDVLGTIGVLNGYPDDTFKPNGTITRAEAAKIIAIFDNQSADISKLYASANPFTDCVGNWAESFIAYGVKTGIIAGRNATTFDPNGNVTGVEFLKMALVVLGYNAKTEGLEGKNWDVNTLALAKRVGLTNSLGAKFEYANPLKRQEAAVIMLDALRADVVEYGSKLGLNNLTEYNWGTQTFNGQVYWTVAGAVSTGKTLGSKWGLEESYASDAFYRPYRTWLLKDTGKEIGRYMLPRAAEYKTAVSGCQVLTDIGVAKTNTKVTSFAHFVNGGAEVLVDVNHTTVGHDHDCAALKTPFGGQGTLTQVFYIDKAAAAGLTKTDDITWEPGWYITEIETWLGEVTSALKKTVNKDGHLISTTSAKVDLFTGTDVHTSNCGALTDLSVVKEGLAQYDYVLAIYSERTDSGFSAGIVDVDVADVVNGKLTGFKNTNYASQTAVDKTYIPDSLHFHEGYKASKNGNNVGGTFGFIYDNYGNVIGMVDEIGTSTKYLVIDKMALTQEDTYNGVLRANVVGLDAKTDEKISVASIVKEDGTKRTVHDFTSMNANSAFFWSELKATFGDNLGTWTLDAYGNYVIDQSVGYRTTGTSVSIVAGNPVIKIGTTDMIAVDADTTFLIHENDGSYTSVTGYKKIDTLKADNIEYVDNNSDGVAEIVYVWGAIKRAGDSIVAYVPAGRYQWVDGRYHKLTVYVDDVATDICIDDADFASLTTSASATGMDYIPEQFVQFSYTKVSADSEDYAKIVSNNMVLNDVFYAAGISNDTIKVVADGNNNHVTADGWYGLADDVVVYSIKNGVVAKADKDLIDQLANHATVMSEHHLHLGFNAKGQVNVIYVNLDPAFT